MFKSNRREFLGVAAGAMGAVTLGSAAYGAADQQDRKLKLGVIGVGWYGMVDAKAALKVGGVEIVAVCDVDSEHLTGSADELEKLQGTRPADVQALPGVARPPGARRGDHRHAAPLARAAVPRRPGKGARHLLRETAGLRHPRRPGHGRRREEARPRSSRSASSGGRARPSGRSRSSSIRARRARSCRSTCRSITSAGIEGSHAAGSARRRSTGTCGAAPARRSPTVPQVGHMNWRLEKTSGHGHLVDWGIHLIDATR